MNELPPPPFHSELVFRIHIALRTQTSINADLMNLHLACVWVIMNAILLGTFCKCPWAQNGAGGGGSCVNVVNKHAVKTFSQLFDTVNVQMKIAQNLWSVMCKTVTHSKCAATSK